MTFTVLTEKKKKKSTSSLDHLILPRVFLEFLGSLVSGSVEWRSSSSSSLWAEHKNIENTVRGNNSVTQNKHSDFALSDNKANKINKMLQMNSEQA